MFANSSTATMQRLIKMPPIKPLAGAAGAALLTSVALSALAHKWLPSATVENPVSENGVVDDGSKQPLAALGGGPAKDQADSPPKPSDGASQTAAQPPLPPGVYRVIPDPGMTLGPSGGSSSGTSGQGNGRPAPAPNQPPPQEAKKPTTLTERFWSMLDKKRSDVRSPNEGTTPHSSPPRPTQAPHVERPAQPHFAEPHRITPHSYPQRQTQTPHFSPPPLTVTPNPYRPPPPPPPPPPPRFNPFGFIGKLLGPIPQSRGQVGGHYSGGGHGGGHR